MIVGVTDIILLVVYFFCLYFTVFWLLVLLDKDKVSKKKLKFLPKVTIAIPAYNEEDSIKPTIESVLKLNYPKNKLEIIVINDGSTDKTKSIVQNLVKKNKNLTLINQKNKGKGAALNVALKNSEGEYFASLDADSFVTEDALKKMLPHFNKKRVAAVLPLLKVKNPENLIQKVQWYEYLINMFYKSLMGKLDAVHVTPGPFAVYKTSIIKNLGGYDENNLTEDLEIAMRLQKNNYRIKQILDAEVYTIAPKTLKELMKQRNRWYKGSIYNTINYRKLIFNKEYGDFGIMKMPVVLLSGVFAITILLTFTYDLFKPIFQYLRNLFFIRFDIFTLIKNLSFDFNILDLNFIRVSIAIFVLTLSVIVFYLSHKFTNEKITEHGKSFLSLIYYLLIYSFLLSIVWCKIAFDLIIKKKQKW